MGRIINWKVLIDRFKARLSGWKANLLSIGGRLTLIKSVLGSLGIYYLSIFKASEAVKVVKSIHGDEASININGYQTNGLWASIVGTIDHLHSSVIIPLRSMYFKLFHLAKEKNCLVRDCIDNGSWSWDWSRPINMCRSQAEFVSLGEIRDMEIDDDSDSCIWSLSHDGDLSVSNVRKHIDDCMLPNLLLCTRWYKVISRKVNIFMWRLFLDRLPLRLNLSSRGLDIDSILCPVCNMQVECNIHIFFSCDTTSVVWRLVRA
ncbi:RNA-directed DNA polymerase, eukaryota, reverse transcriptase zinc-binding domain protein [Tanacetum coccineum]